MMRFTVRTLATLAGNTMIARIPYKGGPAVVQEFAAFLRKDRDYARQLVIKYNVPLQ